MEEKMIPCRKCGHMMNASSSVCPNCGKKNNSYYMIGISLIIIGAFFFIWDTIRMYG